MQRTIRRLALVASCALILSALAAAPALAAPATTFPASSVTTTTATLSGNVTTAGAPAFVTFQYGTTTGYGKVTPTLAISASSHGNFIVSATVTGLSPGTTYHVRLVAAIEATPYTIALDYGEDVSFTTNKLGALALQNATLTVKNGSVSVPLKCSGIQSCKGKLSITTRVKFHNHFTTDTCASSSFKINAGKKQTLKTTLSTICKALLKKAPNGKLGAALSAKFTTGQPQLKKNVTLKRS